MQTVGQNKFHIEPQALSPSGGALKHPLAGVYAGHLNALWIVGHVESAAHSQIEGLPFGVRPQNWPQFAISEDLMTPIRDLIKPGNPVVMSGDLHGDLLIGSRRRRVHGFSSSFRGYSTMNPPRVCPLHGSPIPWFLWDRAGHRASNQTALFLPPSRPAAAPARIDPRRARTSGA